MASASGGYGSASSGNSGGYSSGGSSGGGSGYSGQVVNAAIQTRHEIQFRDVPSTGSVEPSTIEVGASSIPLNILFRSASSNLNVLQHHDGAQGSTQESDSEDEPHILKHSVTKPIIQEVREIVSPFRKIVQEIQPVQEEILTIVSKSDGRSGGNSGGAGGFGGSSGGRGSGFSGLGLGGSIGNGGSSGTVSVGGTIEIPKAATGTGLGKGLAGKSATGYASSAKASSSSKGGY